MDSVKTLLDQNCEGFNPILNLCSQINHAQTLSLDHNNDFVQEYLSVIDENRFPTTFKMHSLIREINNSSSNYKKIESKEENLISASNWLSQYKPETVSTNWEDEYNLYLSDNHLKNEMISKNWINELYCDQSQNSLMCNDLNLLPSAWLSEFENQNIDSKSKIIENPLSVENDIENSEYKDILQMMKNEWENCDSFHPWSADFENFKNSDSYQEYEFERNNPLLDEEDVLNEGLKRLKIGDIANAVLYFEAAVRQDSNNSQAWMLLGTTQADNEMEAKAISALNKCLEIDPDNLTAIMSLAVSYTNEMMSMKACDLLRRWLLTNPLYKDLKVEGLIDDDSVLKNHAYTRDLYIAAVQRNTQNIDADLQIGLGVLFNLSGDYDKAVDCFKTALQIRPEDNLLWNKLGATLANGHRSEEAIDAYRRSLALSSGHVRTRYNLGIACINLQAYRESIEHFISALDLQRNSVGPNSTSGVMSENIWSSLKMAISLLGRSDLMQVCTDKDIDFLKSEFNFKIDS